jgi:pimeloyl-ACP methyl ester carboxylesterase
MSFMLAHRSIEGAGAEKTSFVLHGILGAGQNFTAFIQKLARRRPEYRYALVDLRNHGASSGAPPPHTVAAAARDLAALAQKAGEPSLVIGHSFGGKVALEYARQGAPRLEQVWALDSNPGPQGAGEHREVDSVIAAIRGVPTPAATRAEVVRVLGERGLSRPTAEWLATSLKRTEAGYVWLFDLDGIEELLRDYYELDLWGFLAEPRSRPTIELVIAAESDRWTGETRKRALALPASAGVTCHVLPDSGHWVHVDNPAALLELMATRLA